MGGFLGGDPPQLLLRVFLWVVYVVKEKPKNKRELNPGGGFGFFCPFGGVF